MELVPRVYHEHALVVLPALGLPLRGTSYLMSLMSIGQYPTLRDQPRRATGTNLKVQHLKYAIF